MNTYITKEIALDAISHAETLSEAFRLINSQKAADVVEVRHAEWKPSHKHVWQLDEDGRIDMFAVDHGYHNGPRCAICGKGFCKHCTPDWASTKCDKEHFECPECGNHSLTKTAYCPKCGTKMDGGQDDASNT